MAISLLQSGTMHATTRLLVKASEGVDHSWMLWFPWIDIGASTVIASFVYVLPLVFLFSLDLSLLRLFPECIRRIVGEGRFVLFVVILEIGADALLLLLTIIIEQPLEWLLRDAEWLDVGTSGAIMGSAMSIVTITVAQYLLWIRLALLILWHGDRAKA